MSYENLINLADVKVGMSQDAIAALPTVEYTPDGEVDPACCICMCDYDECESINKLKCGHCFHTGCLEQWLKTHTACPICKDPTPGEKRTLTPERNAEEVIRPVERTDEPEELEESL